MQVFLHFCFSQPQCRPLYCNRDEQLEHWPSLGAVETLAFLRSRAVETLAFLGAVETLAFLGAVETLAFLRSRTDLKQATGKVCACSHLLQRLSVVILILNGTSVLGTLQQASTVHPILWTNWGHRTLPSIRDGDVVTAVLQGNKKEMSCGWLPAQVAPSMWRMSLHSKGALPGAYHQNGWDHDLFVAPDVSSQWPTPDKPLISVNILRGRYAPVLSHLPVSTPPLEATAGSVSTFEEVVTFLGQQQWGRESWGSSSHGAAAVMGQQQSWGMQQSWGSSSHGAAAVMGQQQSWGSSSHGAAAVMGQQQSWGSSSHGAAAVMGQQQSWGSSSHGAAAVG
ncbi:hypothetical protein EMCRGX_G009035 [Ephydatia muelleri]